MNNFCNLNKNNKTKLDDCAGKDFDCRVYFGSDHLTNKRAKKFQCRSKRIQILAQPKYLTQRIVYEEPDLKIEGIKGKIVRDHHGELSTRIKMLAMPKVRKLMASRNEYKEIIEKQRVENYDNFIQQSMKTIYSRLSNVHLPKRRQNQKWTREDWIRHCQWLKKRACPKIYTQPKQPPREIVPLRDLEVSIYSLSQPRYPRQKFVPLFNNVSTVKDSVKYYTPSKRILKLAERKFHYTSRGKDNDEQFNPWQVSQNALTFTLSMLKKLI